MNMLLVASLATAFAAPGVDGAGGDAWLGDGGAVSGPIPGDAPRPDAIWNGTEVPAGGHPAVVAVAGETADGLFLFCSGTLVTPDWVLTAAHCLQDVSNLVVLFGDDLVEQGYTDAIAVSESHPHPDYRSDAFLFDIGLVRLEEPKTDVLPVVLNDEPVGAVDHGEELLLVGFGFDPPDGGSGVKREATVTLVSHTDQLVLTNDPEANLCQGDSGGPGFEAEAGVLEQVGVNSFVTPDCVDGSGGLTRVDTFIPWIRSLAPDVQLGEQVVPPDDDDPRGPNVPDGIDPDGFGPDPDADDEGAEAGCDTTGVPGGWIALGALLALRRRRAGARPDAERRSAFSSWRCARRARR